MTSKPIPPGAIVVGVDGSPSGDLALDWAVEECTRRSLPLHVIHAFSYGYPMTSTGMGYAAGGLRERAEDVRLHAITRARRANPKLVVSSSDPADGAAASLVSASETADTVVVGAAGITAGRNLVVGSVSVQVAAHAHCPVVVVHDTPRPAGAPVVVGLDGSALSTNAIAYAYAQASARGVGLTVVHGWWQEYVEGASASGIWTDEWQKFADEEQALVAQSLAGWTEKYPNVVVRRHSVRGLPVETLVRQSEDAALMVVGTRGRGEVAGLLLGSVSQGVMHSAHCPVAIIHGRKTKGTHQDHAVMDAPAEPLLQGASAGVASVGVE